MVRKSYRCCQQMMENNPYVNNNPALRSMLADPQVMQRMFEPENMQAMMQMQQAMQQLSRAGLIPNMPSGMGMGMGMDPAVMQAMQGAFPGAAAPASQDNRPPEER